MTDLQRRFADEYLIDSSIANAAKRAGVQGDNYRIVGWQFMQIPEVQEYIELKQSEITQELGISALWVQKRFKEVSDKCMQVEPVMIKVDGVWVESGEYQFDSAGVIGATRELGKIIGVYEKDNGQKKIELPKTMSIEIVKPKDED